MLRRTSKTSYTTFRTSMDEAVPTVMTIADLQKPANLLRFVKIENVMATTNRQGFKILKDTVTNATVRIEDHFNVFYELNDTVQSIEGIIGISTDGTIFLWPTSKAGVQSTKTEQSAEPQPQPVEKVEKTKVWDFTAWSAATVEALKADAAASKTEGWSDVEKKADAEAGAEPTEASKDNCFWLAGAPNADGELTANGTVIEETKGLLFHNAGYTGARSLAIAVNYPTTSLGNYAGGQYLWLGGKGQECFTIPGCTAGGSLTIVAESHKPAEARGIELYQGGAKIGELKPTVQASQTFNIEADGDVIVKNTNGCHIYSITMVYLADKEAEEEPAGSAVNFSWESPDGTVIETGGTATYEHGKEGEDRTNYKNGDYYTLCLNGKKGNLNDAAASANAGYILITLDDALQGGETISITAYINKNESKKASAWLVFESGATIESAVYSDAANIDPVFNGVPTETTITVPAEAAGSKTIKMTRSQSGTNLFITKLTIKGQGGEEPVPTGISNMNTIKAEGVYSLSGVKISDTTEGLKPGLYIIGGRVVAVK